MKVEKKELKKSQIELLVELSVEEFEPYIQKGADRISKDVKIDGFRSGKVPFDVLKQKIGEMAILEEAARVAINKTLHEVLEKNVEGQPVGQPQVDIVKLAPGNPVEYKVVLSILPSVELGDYKGLKVKEEKVKVDEKEIDKTIDELRESKAVEVLTEEAAKEGDKIVIDIDMFLDKVPVEGGQSKDTAVIIGKDEYIVPGFGKKVTGAKKGDKKDFSLPYPKDHHMKNLAGKMVDFKVVVKDVFSRTLPPVDDQLAVDFGLKKLDELKKNIEESIKMQKGREIAVKNERAIFDAIIKDAKFGDIPEVLIDHEAKTIMAELEQGVAQQGGKFEDYLTSLGKTQNELTMEMLPEAINRVKVSLLIREIANAEKIGATDKEIEENIEQMKQQYKDNKDIIARVEAPEYRVYISNVMTSRKVVEKLLEWTFGDEKKEEVKSKKSEEKKKEEKEEKKK